MARQDQGSVPRAGRKRGLHRLGATRPPRLLGEDQLIRSACGPTTVRKNRVPEPDAERAFRRFFDEHHADLSRLAYLVTGETQVAGDLASDAFVEVWRHWERVQAADSPIAYARGILANLARQWIKRQSRERLGLLRLGLPRRDRAGPGTPALPGVPAAPRPPPPRR